MSAKSTATSTPDYSDETALLDQAAKLGRLYRRYLRITLPLAFIAAIAVGTWVSFHPVYNVSAILDTPKLTLNEWRSFVPMLSDKNGISASLSTLQDLDEKERDNYTKRFINPRFWETSVQYRTALRRDDIKETPNADPKTTDTLGLEITLSASDESKAVRRLEVMAQHLRQTMIRARLTNYLHEQQQLVAHSPDESALGLAKQQFLIDQSKQRIADMQALLDSYPELRRMDVNTVVSVADGGGKYLSPLAQIVALNATISEANATMRSIRRAQEEMQLRGKFLASLGPLPDVSGSQLAGWLSQRKNAFFKSIDLQSPVANEVSHSLDLSLSEPVWYAGLWQFKNLPANFNSPVLLRRPLPMGMAAFLLVSLLLPLVLAAILPARRQPG